MQCNGTCARIANHSVRLEEALQMSRNDKEILEHILFQALAHLCATVLFNKSARGKKVYREYKWSIHWGVLFAALYFVAQKHQTGRLVCLPA